MLRYLGSYGRTILASSSPSSSSALLRLVRPASNQTKTVQTRPTEENVRTRLPSSTKRQVNLKKLFSDEPAENVDLPRTPRRPNILHSSSVDQPTQTRYEQDIDNIDDYQSEENRRRTARQTENKSPKSKGKKATTKRIETDFDGTEFVPSQLEEKLIGKQSRKITPEENDLQQPKQPRRERSLTTPAEPVESRNSSPDRRTSTPVLSSSIREASNIEELMKIFDQYVVPTEFAMGLQKMSQMASAENSDAVPIYTQLESTRQRMETLLLSFLNKFTDYEVVTAIGFVTKFYPEDNEFTDKFSLGLNNRLRRISVHQIVRILDELKSSRHTAQWIHRTYNRLLALAEGRYFEFDNIRDILAMTYKLSYNDRLISRLDERILEISDTLTFDDWFKVLVNKSMLKRRDRTVIRAACYHLLKLSDASLFPLEKLKDCLLACAMLNVHEKNFLERLIRDAFEQVNELKDPFVLQSIITSMGTLRLRHCELLDALARLLIEEAPAPAKSKSLQSFVRTCAAVNYSPALLPILVEKHLNLEEKPSDETTALMDLKNRIDLVWSLAILDLGNASHLATVLNQETYQLIQNEVTNSKIASALKLLSIYSYSGQKSSKRFVKPTFNIEQLAQQLTLKNANAQDQLAKTVTSFAAENKFSKFSVVTSNMIVIDCLMVVDNLGTPQDLNAILTGNESAGTTYNKVRIDDNRYKIALKCLDYQDKTLLTNSISGPLAFQMRLLTSLGYKCVPIHYDEFSKIQVPNDRVKYVQRKIKEAISNSPKQEIEDD